VVRCAGAEQARPGTFRALYWLRAGGLPYAGRWSSRQKSSLRRGQTAAGETFLSAEGRLHQFLLQAAFAISDPEVLKLYVNLDSSCCLRAEDGDGKAIRLRCRRDDEAEIYAHGPSARVPSSNLKEIGCH